MVREYTKHMQQWRRKTVVMMLLLWCFLAVSVRNGYADEDPAFILGETIEGDQLIAVVSFTSGPCAAGTMKLNYQADALELLSVDKVEAGIEVVNVNHVAEKDQISVNFYNTYGPVEGDTRLAELRFKIKKNPLSGDELYAESFRLYNIDSKLLSDSNSTKLQCTLDGKQVDLALGEPASSDGKKASDAVDAGQETQDIQGTDDKQGSDSSQTPDDSQKTDDSQKSDGSGKADDSGKPDSGQETADSQKSDDARTPDDSQEPDDHQSIDDKQESGQENADSLNAEADNAEEMDNQLDQTLRIVTGVAILVVVVCFVLAFILWKKEKKGQGHDQEPDQDQEQNQEPDQEEKQE